MQYNFNDGLSSDLDRNKTVSRSIYKKRPRRRISRARKAAFRRKKQDTLLQIFHPLLYFIGLVFYLELVFHIGKFPNDPGSIISVLWLPIVVAAFFAIFTTFFRAKTNKIIGLVFTCLLCILFAAEVVYNAVFRSYFALFSIFKVAGQALDFTDLIFQEIMNNLVLILLLLVPIPIYAVIVWRKMSFRKKRYTVPIAYGIVGFAAFGMSLLFMKVSGNDPDSTSATYYKRISIDEEICKLGVLTTTRLDLKDFVFGAPDISNDLYIVDNKTDLILPPGMDQKRPNTDPTQSAVTNPTKADKQNESASDPGNASSTDPTQSSGEIETEPQPTEAPEPVVYEPNIMDLDFEYLNTLTDNKTIKNINTYISMNAPTYKNEWTGKFKGYNVIEICAEGFSKYVVDPERTPTLYRLSHEGFVFNHYYTPLWYGSTSGGEFATLTGLMPKNGGYVSLTKTGELGTNMYMTLGRRLSAMGYYTFAGHNNSNTYYGRNLSMPNMGYEFFATNQGYDPELSKRSGKPIWPQSDLRLIEQSFPLYYQKEPFHTYYMTVSGHCNYTKTGNSMAYRNWDLVKDMPYQLEETKGYIACHYELEKALTKLVEYLEENDLADHTLIVLTADHVPYNDKELCDELAGHVLDSNIEWFESTLIMWSGSMKEPVIVDKYCTQTDILPTIMNLLGVTYDSRMMVGRDILSNSSQLVIFKNGSFITDHCIYNSGNDDVQILSDAVPVDANYLKEYKRYIEGKWAFSTMMIEADYYTFLEPYLPK